MNNVKNLVRLWTSQLGSAYYWGPIVAAMAIVFFSLSVSNNGNNQPTYPEPFFVVEQSIVVTIVGMATFFSLFGMSIGLWQKLVKEKRTELTLTLPASQGEKFAAVLVMNYLVLPAIAAVPLVLITVFLCTVAPEWLIMPEPATLFPDILLGVAVHWLVSSLYFFPSIAFPKRSVITIVGVAILAVAATAVVATHFGEYGAEVVDTSIYQEGNIIGLSYDQLNNKASEMKAENIDVPAELDSPGIWGYLLYPFPLLFLLIGYLALQRREA